MSKEIGLENQIFFGMVTVSDKGQIAIPVDARNALGIESGAKLLVIKRRDEKGISLVKVEVMDEILRSMQE